MVLSILIDTDQWKLTRANQTETSTKHVPSET
jgi:hypothetical protein